MASLSKRAQARNERELHELLGTPGNGICADCSAKNPAWASWNLGVFLCMRCASIHRKLGTHISKVKSLSMDTWTSDQVESMRKNGNVAVNKIYNPKGKRPDIPVDADEADSAMERFIRKKYQEKSLVDGKPEPPSRLDASPNIPHSPKESSMTPQLPPKKHKFFGFGLRASHDKKKGGPRVDSAFPITQDEMSPVSARSKEMSELELQEKLVQLRDMGFTNTTQNTTILKKAGGDLERSIALLVKITPSRTPEPPSQPPQAQRPSTSGAAQEPSNNPFMQPQSTGFGLSFDNTPKQQPQSTGTSASAGISANPWQTAMQSSGQTGLENQFQNMQVAQPLFPHSTGGHAATQAYQDPSLHTFTPPVPSIPQQYSHASSPTLSTGTNPFHQAPLSAQSTGGNPFYQQQAQSQQPAFAPRADPFMSAFNQPQQQFHSQSPQQTTNPFGLLPDQQQQTSLQNMSAAQPTSTNPFGNIQAPHQIQHAQTFPLPQQTSYTAQTSPNFPNFQYGQPQQQQISSQAQHFMSQQAPFQNQPQQQFPQQSSAQPQSLVPQQTGRYTKNDILSLFSQPTHYAQTPQLASVPESHDDGQSQLPPQPISPAPGNPYVSMNANAFSTQRSATMPAAYNFQASASPSPGPSRNPFMNNAAPRQVSDGSAGITPFGTSQPGVYGAAPGIGVRHTSNESVSVNNPGLLAGRHSPDAFASFSARY